MQKNKYLYLKVIALLILLVSPWLNADYSDEIYPQAPVQEDMSFYEINPCKVSLVEFLLEVPIASYQDHYHFRFNNYSSISCFGRISGVTLLNNEFYISIGTNSFINLILQTLFWITLISFVKKSSKFRLSKERLLTIVISTFLLTNLIISESRFYEQNFYLFDFTNSQTKIGLRILILFSFFHIVNIIVPRLGSIVNLLPYILIFSGVYSGFNISFYLFVLIFCGIFSLITRKNMNSIIFLSSTIPLLYFWTYNANDRYSFKVDKLRGFSSSSFDSSSNLLWATIFIIVLIGLFDVYRNNLNHLNFEKIYKHFCNSTILIILFGVVGANFPLANFFNYFYLGQQKYGVSIRNPFSFDIYGQKIAWRGIFSSSEFAGEVFALFLVFTTYMYFSKFRYSKIYYIGIISSILGLYFSNNRAAFLLLIFIGLLIFFLTNRNFVISSYKFWGLISLFMLLVVYQIGFNNFTYSFEFIQNYTFSKASEFNITGNRSSFYNLLTNTFNGESVSGSFFGFVSIFSFFLNRSILWGLFIARYNPSSLELLFGTGPLSFGKYFGEIKVDEINSLLLPHSSVLSYLIFIGVFGIASFFAFFVYAIYKNKTNLSIYSYLLFIFIALNIVKSDSLLYLQAIIFYSLLVFIFIKKDNLELLKIKEHLKK